MANSPAVRHPVSSRKCVSCGRRMKTLPEKTERIKEMWMSLRTLQRLPPDLYYYLSGKLFISWPVRAQLTAFGAFVDHAAPGAEA